MDWLIVGIVVVLLGAFMIGREVIWWYFGIDRAIAALESMDASLKQLPAVRRYEDDITQRKHFRA